MTYDKHDRLRMFWSQCMQIVGNYLAQKGIDFMADDKATEQFWNRVTRLYKSGIERDVLELPLVVAKKVEAKGKEVKKVEEDKAKDTPTEELVKEEKIEDSKTPELKPDEKLCPKCQKSIPIGWKAHSCGWKEEK